MQVKINGKAEEIRGGSVLDLLKLKKIEPQMVAVEVNDQVEFLFYMGGGR